MKILNVMRRIVFGVVWYSVIFFIMSFLLTRVMTSVLNMTGNDYSGQLALEAYAHNHLWMMAVAIILAAFGTIKGVLPGTAEIWSVKKPMLGSIDVRAVILGALVDFSASFLILWGVGLLWVMQQSKFPNLDNYDLNQNLNFLMVCLLIKACSLVLGGYVAGRIAKQRLAEHGCAVGILGMVRGLFYCAIYPLWFNAIVFCAMIPLAMWGGYLAKVKE